MNDEELKTLLGLKIKTLRNKCGFTQEELGERIGRTQRQVSLIELGLSFPNPVTLSNIVKALNCSVKDLFDFEGMENIADIKSEILKIVSSMPDDKLKILYIVGKNL